MCVTKVGFKAFEDRKLLPECISKCLYSRSAECRMIRSTKFTKFLELEHSQTGP
jgi:hypothetical protein